MHRRWSYVAIGLTVWTAIFLIGSFFVLSQFAASRQEPTVVDSSVQQTFICSPSNASPIKGNGDSMIYHLPTCSSYNSVVIGNNSKDQLFATEAEAQAAGFRKAENCP